MIEARLLSKFYGQHKAAANISFKIGDGEIVGLLGLNGAGKSTILKMLGTYLAPSAGEAFIGGFSVTDQPERVRQLMGYLPDRSPLYDEMTVQGYLQYVAQLKDVPRSDVAARVSSVVEKTNLEEVVHARMDTLSHGFKQRVGIAQALVHSPKVLILDEPINGLDPIQIVEMRDLILSLKGKHTVVLSSHILSEITKTCDRILVIDKGTLVAEGSERDLEKRLMGGTRVRVEWAGNNSKVEGALQRVPTIRQIHHARQDQSVVSTVESDQDVRAAVAKTIVENGGELLGLRKADEGLESLFVKLVNTPNGGANNG